MNKNDLIKFLIAFLIFLMAWHLVSFEVALAMEAVFYIGVIVESILIEKDR